MRYIFCTLYLLVSLLSAIAQPVISLDTSFNSTGYTTINLMNFRLQNGSTIRVNPSDGKYFVRAYVNPLGAFLKFNRDGRYDTSFNHSGVLVQPLSENYKGNFFIDPAGNLMSASHSPNAAFLMRFYRTTPAGIPDSSFGIDSRIEVSGSNGAIGSFIQLPNGGFMLSNLQTFGSFPFDFGFNIMKLKSNYTMDSSFGTNGIKVHQFAQFAFKDIYLRKTLVQPDGKILIAGSTNNETFAFNYRARLFRFLPNGDPDPGFGVNGIATPNFDSTRAKGFYDCMVLPDGKIVAAGFRMGLNGSTFGFVGRYLPNGAPDSSFGVFGKTDFPECRDFFQIKRQRDGKLLITGEGKYPIIRLTEDGMRDIQVGTNGVFTSPFPGANGGFPFEMFVENDTTVLLTGNAFEFTQGYNVTTARYKIRFQPFVTGLKSKYCIGETGTGRIINLPSPTSDTTVTVKVDNTLITLNAIGDFSFAVGVAGNHTVEIKFTQGARSWVELFKFTTYDHTRPQILTADQLVCATATSFTVSANTPVVWQGNGITEFETGPATSISFDPRNQNGAQQVIAIKDNGSCGITMDTVLLTPYTLNPVVTVNNNILSTPLTPGATYRWQRNNMNISGATANTYTATQDGSYRVTETLGSCNKTSASVDVTLTVTSIIDPVTNTKISLTPNPVNNVLYIKGLRPFAKYHIIITNAYGKTVIHKLISGRDQSPIQIGQLASGVYIATIREDKGKMFYGSEKLVVIK